MSELLKVKNLSVAIDDADLLSQEILSLKVSLSWKMEQMSGLKKVCFFHFKALMR